MSARAPLTVAEPRQLLQKVLKEGESGENIHNVKSGSFLLVKKVFKNHHSSTSKDKLSTEAKAHFQQPRTVHLNSPTQGTWLTNPWQTKQISNLCE